MSELNYEIETLSKSEIAPIGEGLVAFNASKVPFTQLEPFTHLLFGVKNSDGDVIAGVRAVLYCWKCLYVDALWVAQEYRGKGYGARLLATVEDRAKSVGCKLAHLDTFDFQSKDFYLRNGYEVFGELDDCPPGHKRIYLKKIFP